MEKLMNNNVINNIDSLINAIKLSDIYKEYIDLLEKVNLSVDIKRLTNEIRTLLNDIPLYLEYKYKLEELNNMLIVIKNKIELFMKDIIVN